MDFAIYATYCEAHTARADACCDTDRRHGADVVHEEHHDTRDRGRCDTAPLTGDQEDRAVVTLKEN